MICADAALHGVIVLAVFGGALGPVEVAHIASRQLPLAVLHGANGVSAADGHGDAQALPIPQNFAVGLADGHRVPCVGGDQFGRVIHRHRDAGETGHAVTAEHFFGRPVDRDQAIPGQPDLGRPIVLDAGAHGICVSLQIAVSGQLGALDGHGVSELHVRIP